MGRKSNKYIVYKIYPRTSKQLTRDNTSEPAAEFSIASQQLQKLSPKIVELGLPIEKYTSSVNKKCNRFGKKKRKERPMFGDFSLKFFYTARACCTTYIDQLHTFNLFCLSVCECLCFWIPSSRIVYTSHGGCSSSSSSSTINNVRFVYTNTLDTQQYVVVVRRFSPAAAAVAVLVCRRNGRKRKSKATGIVDVKCKNKIKTKKLTHTSVLGSSTIPIE